MKIVNKNNKRDSRTANTCPDMSGAEEEEEEEEEDTDRLRTMRFEAGEGVFEEEGASGRGSAGGKRQSGGRREEDAGGRKEEREGMRGKRAGEGGRSGRLGPEQQDLELEARR
eukprot:753146-Hanusia_phi.AAC.2